MRSMTGFRRAGLLAILAAILLPVSGIGTASADLTVGETISLKVPDRSQFAEDPEVHQFTCRAVTEHAYWLVQDTSTVAMRIDSTAEPVILWPDVINQGEIDSLTEQFEGGDVDVYGTLTSAMGAPQQTVNGDEKLYIMLADVPDIYQKQEGPYRAGITSYVWPEDFDGDSETGNNVDAMWIGVGWYLDSPTIPAEAKAYARTIAVPEALAQYIRYTYNLDEELWLVRGIGLLGQYITYGFTSYSTVAGNIAGIAKALDKFMSFGQLDIALWNSGKVLANNYYRGNAGGAFMFLMWAQQNSSGDIIPAVTSGACTGMMNVGMAVDPSADSATVIEDVMIPLYSDFIVANAVHDLAADYEGGMYHYDFLDQHDYDFAMVYESASMDGDVDEYPDDSTYVTPVMASPAWSARYFIYLKPDGSSELPQETAFFNGRYNQNNGSGPNIDSQWYLQKVVIDNGAVTSVSDVTLDDMYNGTIALEGDSVCVISTNNYPGGATEIASIYSLNEQDKDLLVAFMQNPGNPQFIQAYTSLYRTANWSPTGFDWVGPGINATLDDSTSMVPMELFSGTIWGGIINLWSAGQYTVSTIAWDSLGVSYSKTRQIDCDYSEADGMVLEINEARLDVQAGSGAPGQMAVLMDTDMLGLSVGSSLPLGAAADAMTGVTAGPVSVSDIAGDLSFAASDNSGAVYKWNGEAWERLESSYYQSGRMHAMIDGGGIYVYGDAPGVSSPEIPSEMILRGSFPNPFVAQAAINFSLPTAGRATLRVFDLSGRLITTLADEEMAAADHTVVWNGRDASGNEVGAGVYFCRLEAAGQTATQKMLRIE